MAGSDLKAAREALGLSQSTVAAGLTRRMGRTITQPQISAWERDEYGPTTEHVAPLAAELKISADELLVLLDKGRPTSDPAPTPDATERSLQEEVAALRAEVEELRKIAGAPPLRPERPPRRARRRPRDSDE